MKNRLKNSLLIIIGIICILPIGIKAETTETTTGLKCKVLRISQSKTIANIPGLHTGHLYTFYINGTRALCLDSGKRASGSFQYKSAGTGSSVNIGKAAAYMKRGGTYTGRIAAQVIAWMPGGGRDAWRKAIKYILTDLGMPTSANDAQVNGAIDAVMNTGYSSYCIFESDASNSQRIVISGSGDKCRLKCTPIKDTETKCPQYKIHTTSEIPACKEDAVPSFAYFSEHSEEVDNNGDPNTNEYGVETANVGTGNYCKIYCLEEASVTLPGAPNEVDIGSATLAWPTSKSTNNNNEGANKYPLKFTGKKKCHIYVSSGQACSYESIVEKYEKHKNYVDSHASSRVNICDAGNYKTKTCTIISKSLENTRREWGNGGNHNDDYPMVKNYYKNTYHSKIENNKNSAQNDYDSAKTTYDAALASCKSGTHNESGTKNCNSKNDCICTDNKYPCSIGTTNTVSNTESWCNGNDDTTKSAKEELDKAKEILDFWSDEESKSNTIMSQIDGYAHQYWNAEDILVQLRACEKYDFNANISKLYNGFKSSASVEYEGKTYELDEESNANYKCISGCEATNNFKEKDDISTQGDLITKDKLEDNIERIIEKEVTLSTSDIGYKLKEGTGFKYIDVSTGKLTNTKPEGAFKKLISPNIPLGEDFGKVKKKYEIEVKLGAFGTSGQFNWGNAKYVCPFEPKLPDGCLCPPETNYAGLNLAYIQIAEGLTCADAQVKYCQKPNYIACPDGTHKDDVESCINDKGGYTKDRYDACVSQYCSNRYACPDGSKAEEMTACIGDNYIDNYPGCYYQYCVCENCYICGEDTDYPMKVIDSCVAKNEKIYGSKAEAAKYCKQKMCYKYECPENTPNYKMDISNCVELYLKNGGYSLKDITSQDDSRLKAAIKACVNAVCPAKGIKIIYRTIKLENPFPSYDADSTTIKNLKKKTFNLYLSGRYPGSNWNGRILVYNEIINNRSDRQFSNEESINNTQSFIGSTLYQTKEPLYTFDLTPAIINQIRRYNDEQQRGNKGGYSDFTLTCKKNSSAACISDFIWGRTSAGNVGLDTSNSKCTNRTQDFYSCTNG